MSSEPVRGVVVAHAALAEAMVTTVGRICGDASEGLRPLSNAGLSPAALGEAVRGVVGEGPAIVFTDLAAGSCGVAARRLVRERPRTAVVSGFNVPMLVDFVFNRERPLEELVERLVERGRAGILADAGGGDVGRFAAG